MEFFSRDRLEPDERVLETMGVLGSQVGQFVARRQAEAEVRASESRLKAMLASALDAVVTMDHNGRVLGWNHAAETTFGYRADEVVGRDMADLIVPPSLRDKHRTGLARFLETEHPVILDRRLELTGLHKNGTEFPVELTITKIGLPGPPTSPATCVTSRTGSRPRRGSALPAPALSKSPTKSAVGSSATSTTAPSSGSPRCS